MVDAANLSLFLGASVLLAFAPGPDNIFVLTQSILYGRKAGITITMGLCTGLLVHTTVVALGLAAVFQTSVIAFSILKYIGAAYLFWLAVSAFRSSNSAITIAKGKKLNGAQLYRRGILMNVTNPKVSIFFLAFLPQFTRPSNGAVAVQIIELGFLFIAVTLLVFSLIAFISGLLGERIAKSGRWQTILNRVAGTVYAALALKLVFTRQN